MRIATAGVGIPAITTVRTTTLRRRITAGRTDRAIALRAITATALGALLLALAKGEAVAVAFLLVPGAGIPAIATGRVGITASRTVIALRRRRRVRLTRPMLL